MPFTWFTWFCPLLLPQHPVPRVPDSQVWGWGRGNLCEQGTGEGRAQDAMQRGVCGVSVHVSTRMTSAWA